MGSVVQQKFNQLTFVVVFISFQMQLFFSIIFVIKVT